MPKARTSRDVAMCRVFPELRVPSRRIAVLATTSRSTGSTTRFTGGARAFGTVDVAVTRIGSRPKRSARELAWSPKDEARKIHKLYIFRLDVVNFLRLLYPQMHAICRKSVDPAKGTNQRGITTWKESSAVSSFTEVVSGTQTSSTLPRNAKNFASLGTTMV